MTTTPIAYIGIPSDDIRKVVNAPLVEMIKQALIGRVNCQRPKKSQGVGYNYILNQSVRQYVVPEENIHVTVAAQELWNMLFLNSPEPKPDIRVYAYQDRIYPSNDVLAVDTYNGNAKNKRIKRNVVKGEPIEFNKLFIEEHTTPIADMAKALLYRLEASPKKELSSSEIVEILDKMHVTKMLKDENIKISLSKGRIATKDIITMTSQDVFNKICQSTIGYPHDYVCSDTPTKADRILAKYKKNPTGDLKGFVDKCESSARLEKNGLGK